jgi:hypothetical protein
MTNEQETNNQEPQDQSTPIDESLQVEQPKATKANEIETSEEVGKEEAEMPKDESAVETPEEVDSPKDEIALEPPTEVEKVETTTEEPVVESEKNK